MNDAWKFFKRWSRSARYERKSAKRYAETIANPVLSPQEKIAIERWRREKLLAEIDYLEEVLRKPLF